MISFRVKFILVLLYFLAAVCPYYGEVLQIDNNFDGKMDQWRHMSSNNKILKIEYDNNGDGKIDQTDIYEKNKTPIRAEVDRNFDGNTDQIQYYRIDGSLDKIE